MKTHPPEFSVGTLYLKEQHNGDILTQSHSCSSYFSQEPFLIFKKKCGGSTAILKNIFRCRRGLAKYFQSIKLFAQNEDFIYPT